MVYVYEYGIPGYIPSYSIECNGQINLGETKNLYDNQRRFTIGSISRHQKGDHNDGGTAIPSDFTMFVNGNYQSPSAFPGSETGTTITIYER